MEPEILGPTGMFYLLAALSALGSAYGYFFMKESRGLTDREKKLLYTPKKFLDVQANKEYDEKK